MRGLLASANYFEVLGVRPAAGRVFEEADDRTDAAVAVIAHSTWTREFDGDPAIVGRYDPCRRSVRADHRRRAGAVHRHRSHPARQPRS